MLTRISETSLEIAILLNVRKIVLEKFNPFSKRQCSFAPRVSDSKAASTIRHRPTNSTPPRAMRYSIMPGAEQLAPSRSRIISRHASHRALSKTKNVAYLASTRQLEKWTLNCTRKSPNHQTTSHLRQAHAPPAGQNPDPVHGLVHGVPAGGRQLNRDAAHLGGGAD